MKTTLILALVASACVGLNALAQTAVPASLQPAAGEALLSTAHARGVQIYECRAPKDAQGKFEWTFTGPEAELADTQGNRVGTHYAGPIWEALDGSKVIGAVRQKADAPDANAIPWLLLGAKSGGPEGTFSRISSIQRVNTTGGKAPSTACSAANAGQSERVAYTADYHFYGAR
jgi:Protein of unknown function (DUF3455)